MEGKFGNNDHEDDSANSPISEPDEAAYLPSPKKSRRNTRKKVVTVPIIDGADGSRSRGEVYPPSDSWSWRKYGQKPIKGSPYPRGYYRCSSSKGCPAKKQVERSRLDPTTLLITYASEHNHTLSSNIKNSFVSVGSTSQNSTSTTTTTEETPDPPANFPPEECAAFANQPDIEPADSNGFAEMAGEFGWLCHVGSTMMDGAATLVGPAWAHNAEVEMLMPIGEEDKLLFGDLGDLPESAVVFRQKSIEIETPCGEAR